MNHGGDPAKARALVDAAVLAGADAVKFQSFVPARLVTRTAPRAPYQHVKGDALDQYSMLEPLVLARDVEVQLAAYCQQVGIQFMSSPFDIESLEHLVGRCHMTTIKLGSGELTHGALLFAAARCRLPLVISTGMSTMGEVEAALRLVAFGLLEPNSTPSESSIRSVHRSDRGQAALREFVTLLHCNSAYPTPIADANVLAVETLRAAFGLRCGYSDHTVGPAASVAAVARGAVAIEKHLTLDREAAGPDHAASMTPPDFARLVAMIRETECALGNGLKGVTSSELPQRDVARRSLVCARPIAAGEVWDETMLTAKRPGTGLSPMHLWSLLGRPARRDYAADDLVDPTELQATLKETGS